ncbi:MAG TPA: organomercurial lyase [Acidimicrobiales bacterium]|jgi:alkylmercury lyase
MDCCEPPVSLDVETTSPEHRLAVRGFVALWNGRQPSLPELDAAPAVVELMQHHGRIVIGPDGRVAGIHGLSTGPTPHHIAHEGRVIHTWCAFDAIGIPAALGLDAHAITTCPTCGRQLDVTFTNGEPTAEPDLRLWLPSSQCDHLLNDLCAHANLDCNTHHLTANHTRPTGSALTVTQAATFGRSTWHQAATALTPP